jgi:hypothetical protein
MSIFASKKFEPVQGRQVFEKLFVNDVCLIDEFEQEIVSNQQHISELKTIYAYMNFLASGRILPEKKFRKIKTGKNSQNLYEFKSKHLRVYVFSIPRGKMVVLGGYKKNQKADIKIFKSIVKEYFEQIDN